jgi:hypothetical protein
MLEKLSTKNPDLGSGEADTFWQFFSLGHIFHIKTTRHIFGQNFLWWKN